MRKPVLRLHAFGFHFFFFTFSHFLRDEWTSPKCCVKGDAFIANFRLIERTQRCRTKNDCETDGCFLMLPCGLWMVVAFILNRQGNRSRDCVSFSSHCTIILLNFILFAPRIHCERNPIDLLRNIKTSIRNRNSVVVAWISFEIRTFCALIFSCSPMFIHHTKALFAVCAPLIFSPVTSRYLLANGNTSSKSRLPQAGKSVSFLCSSLSHIA